MGYGEALVPAQRVPGFSPGEWPVLSAVTAEGYGEAIVTGLANRAFRPGEWPVCRRSTAAGRGAQRGVPGGSPPRASSRGTKLWR
jgi:hypothetical protein